MTAPAGAPLRLGAEVAAALEENRPVVALESTIISHGLPRPRNLAVALELEEIVRAGGACPATIAVIDGVACVGLSADEVDRVATDTAMHKLGRRDLAVACALGASGATTVSATASLAAVAGIRVFATGGLGGVHRGFAEHLDESADLDALSRTTITVVSAGVKSILDVPGTLQRLETLNVTVVGYRTRDFPGFYLTSSGERLDWSVDSAAEVAAIMRQQDALALSGALLVANPVAEGEQLDPVVHDEVLADALERADAQGVSGQQITPFLLAEMVRATRGASLEANLAAVRQNVRLGAEIAGAYAR